MYRGEGETRIKLAKRSGSRIAARMPMIALTECPTKIARQLELAADLQNVVSVTLQRVVFGEVVGREIGPPRANVVEQHDLVLTLESRRDQAPHVLIAAEAVREHHRLAPCHTGEGDVVPVQHAHRDGGSTHRIVTAIPTPALLLVLRRGLRPFARRALADAEHTLPVF